MKNSLGGFRITTGLIALVLGWFALATIFAETFAPKLQYFAQDPALPDPISTGSLAEWAASAAPWRGDLLADLATAQAAPLLRHGTGPSSSETTAIRERALAAVRQSLSLAPHSASMWLLLAVLQNQAHKPNSDVEALKMSYLTSPSDVNLIPVRLALVASSATITDDELQNLARGDIRLILTNRLDLKPAIINAYHRASVDGKAYLEHTVQSIDPNFAASLH
jgi:hypothetical protein